MSRLSRCFNVVCASILSFGCGARNGDELAPPGGFNYAKVSYDPKPIKDPAVIPIPEIDLSQYPNHVVDVEFPDKLPRRAGLAFEGAITGARPKQLGGMLFLQFLQEINRDEKRATASAFLPTKNVQGTMTYHIELHAPREKGKHHFELKIFHPPTLEVPFVIAKGLVEIN